MMFSLSKTSNGKIKCYSCEQEFDISWDTEYGEPLIGDHSINCPICGKNIYFEVEYQYIQ